MRIHPAIIAQAAATTAALMPGAVLPRRRDGRAPQRARPRPALAGVGRPRRDARGGRRGHPRAVDRRAHQPSRPPLHGRERPDLHAARHAAPDPRRRQRRRGWRRSPVGSATASSAPDRSKDVVDAYREAGGDGPALRPGDRLLGRDRSGGPADRPGVVADGGPPRQRDPGAALPGDFEDLAELVDEDDVAAVDPVRTGARSRSSTRSRRTSTPATTTSTCTRSGRISEGFLDFAARSLLPEFDREPATLAS